MDNIISHITYKDLLLKKLSQSVISSIGSQVVVILLYVFLCNFNIFHPVDTAVSTLIVFTSFSTWISLLPILGIIFAQSIICGKDYVYESSYNLTRIQQIISVFSIHNWLILLLNVIVGGTLMWLLMHLNGGSGDLFTSASNTSYLNESSLYLIVGGIWNGIYYFAKTFVSDKQLLFPILPQKKILQLKSKLWPLFKESCIMSIASCLFYIILYSIWGEVLYNKICHFFEVEQNKNVMGIKIYIFLWLYATLYYYNMILMKTFFNLFLTEPVIFPLVKVSEPSLYLQESINMSNVPILQSLACFDLLTLAQWSKSRRGVLFTLSQPGGHPHNWNSLVENVLKLLTQYIDILNRSIATSETAAKTSSSEIVETIQSNLQFSNKFDNLRNMSLIANPTGTDIIDLTRDSVPLSTFPKQLLEKCKKRIHEMVSILKIILGINFLFEKLPHANIQQLLYNGHVIIWSTQGIAELVCVSLCEDNYGIVQKDLPAILTTLINLKHSLDKLNKMPTLTKKAAGSEDFNFKMKCALSSAVKRSLFNIYKTFESYINELPLNKDIINQLQTIVKN